MIAITEFFVIVIGETGDKRNKYYQSEGEWTDSLWTAKRFEGFNNAKSKQLALAIGGNADARIEKILMA